MPRFYSNTAVQTTLQVGITASQTTMSVGSTSGFPTSFPYRLTVDYDTSNAEIVEVTSAAGTTLTISRGVDGTSAVTHNIGATIAHTATAEDFRDGQTHIAATTGVHGLAAGVAVVGTTASQTLTNKTIDAGSNALTNIAASSLTGNFKENTTVPSGAAVVGQVVKGAASQTANLTEWRNSANAVLASVNQLGQLTTPLATVTDLTASGTVTSRLGRFTATAVADIPLIVKAVTSQTGDIMQIRDSTGAVTSAYSEIGQLELYGQGGTGPTGRVLRVFSLGSESTWIEGNGVMSILGGRLVVGIGPSVTVDNATDTIALIVKGHSTQTTNLQEWQSDAAAILARVDNTGRVLGKVDKVALGKTQIGVPSNGSATQLMTYDDASERFDDGSMHDGVASPTRITIPKTGKYWVKHKAVFAANATGFRGSDVHLSGGVNAIDVTRVPALNGFVTSVGDSFIDFFTAGSYLEHKVYQSSAVALDTDLRFQVMFIGE